jgi:hypothetical protein
MNASFPFALVLPALAGDEEVTIVRDGVLDAEGLREIKGPAREQLYAGLWSLQHFLGTTLHVDEDVRDVFYRGGLCSLTRRATQFNFSVLFPAWYTPEMVPWLRSLFAVVTSALAHLRQSEGLRPN